MKFRKMRRMDKFRPHILNYCEARLSSSLDASPQAHISSRDWEHQHDARLRPARHINCDEAALWLGRSSF
jgi:hypothetical protein